MGLIPEEARKMIGAEDPPVHVEVSRRDIIKYSVSTEQILDKYQNGDEAPPMFLFGALRPIVPIDKLGPDGIANASLLPDLPLKRVMAGGTKTRYFRPVKPGDRLVATRSLADMYPIIGRYVREVRRPRAADLSGLQAGRENRHRRAGRRRNPDAYRALTERTHAEVRRYQARRHPA